MRKFGVDIVRIVVGVAVSAGLNASVRPINAVDYASGALITNAQLMRPDGSQHDNECSNDAACNPGSANPRNWTRRCDMSSYSIDEGGNQGGTCK
ncbi:hypothetical protein HYV64_04315 [Candidatus Shapirobacteria bacterium]|nr:hypothetical protein [Candidatus Shapirobacteria bacterium]